MSRLYLWCLCFVSKIPSPPPQTIGGEEAAKIEHPSLLHMDPIYRPTWQRPVGLLAHSWSLLGRGEGCWAASHVRWDPGATTLLLDTYLCISWSLFPSWSHLRCSEQHLRNISLPGSASHLYPDLREPLGSWGLCAFLPVLRSREVMASQQLPPEPCHSCSRGGKGACVRSSSINTVRDAFRVTWTVC